MSFQEELTPVERRERFRRRKKIFTAATLIAAHVRGRQARVRVQNINAKLNTLERMISEKDFSGEQPGNGQVAGASAGADAGGGGSEAGEGPAIMIIDGEAPSPEHMWASDVLEDILAAEQQEVGGNGNEAAVAAAAVAAAAVAGEGQE